MSKFEHLFIWFSHLQFLYKLLILIFSPLSYLLLVYLLIFQYFPNILFVFLLCLWWFFFAIKTLLLLWWWHDDYVRFINLFSCNIWISSYKSFLYSRFIKKSIHISSVTYMVAFLKNYLIYFIFSGIQYKNITFFPNAIQLLYHLLKCPSFLQFYCKLHIHDHLELLSRFYILFHMSIYLIICQYHSFQFRGIVLIPTKISFPPLLFHSLLFFFFSLLYMLLFFQGQVGWGWGRGIYTKRKKITKINKNKK